MTFNDNQETDFLNNNKKQLSFIWLILFFFYEREILMNLRSNYCYASSCIIRGYAMKGEASKCTEVKTNIYIQDHLVWSLELNIIYSFSKVKHDSSMLCVWISIHVKNKISMTHFAYLNKR